MKFTIDTTTKTITVEESYQILELLQVLDSLKEYTVVQTSKIEYVSVPANPIYLPTIDPYKVTCNSQQ